MADTHEFIDICLSFLRSELVIAPVIYHSTHQKHRSACTRKVILSSEMGFLKSIKHRSDGLSGNRCIPIDEIIQSLKLNLRGQAPHLGVIPEPPVGLRRFFFRSPRHGSLLKLLKNRLSFLALHTDLQRRNLFRADEDSWMLLRRKRDGNSVYFLPDNFFLKTILRRNRQRYEQCGHRNKCFSHHNLRNG